MSKRQSRIVTPITLGHLKLYIGQSATIILENATSFFVTLTSCSEQNLLVINKKGGKLTVPISQIREIIIESRIHDAETPCD